jgi:hypothetical protein
MPDENRPNAALCKVIDVINSIVQCYFASHTSIRCQNEDSPSGHDFNQSVVMQSNKHKGLVTLSKCRYCGRVDRQEETELSLMGFSVPPAANFEEKPN